MSFRRIPLESVHQLSFAHEEVLADKDAKSEREHALRSAMSLSNNEHEEIGLIVRLSNGEVVEIISPMVDFEGDLVELQGGHALPLRAIVRVEL